MVNQIFLMLLKDGLQPCDVCRVRWSHTHGPSTMKEIKRGLKFLGVVVWQDLW